MEKSPVPCSPIMHSLASASTIAWLIHQKFELGIPLYRQEKEWGALGLSLSRATMSNRLLAVYRDWLSHVVSHLKQELLKQGHLHIDEAHVQVLKEPGRKNTSDSYMWVYCSIRDQARAVRYFEYQPGREISGSVFKGLYRIYPYGCLFRVQWCGRGYEMPVLHPSAPRFCGCAAKRYPRPGDFKTRGSSCSSE